MSTSHVHPEPESVLLTPLFSRSQQSQALLLPTQETDTDTLSPSAEYLSPDQPGQLGPTNRKDTDSAFVIQQASTICDPDEPSAAQKEDAAYMQWSLEVLVLLFAGAIFMSICLILGHYHKQVLPDWEDLRITLNTLISVLATVLRVAIAFVAFEIIAQLKWEWLTTCFRPVYHAQLFDAASRGIYGSFRLLPTIIRHEPFAVAAISIAVLSLGIGSFTQQSIQTYPCRKIASNVGETAFIKIANTLNKHDMTDSWKAGGEHKRRMNLKAQITIQDAIVNRVQDYHLAPLFECSSGNCTFQSFTEDDESKAYSHASLGVCNKCADIYSLVEGPMDYNDDGSNVTVFELPFRIYEEWPGHGPRWTARISGKNKVGFREMTTTTVDDVIWARDAVSQEFLDLALMSVANFTILTTSQSGCNSTKGGDLSCPHDCQNRKESTLREDERCLPRNEDSYDPVAAACILYPCLKYHIANVTNARLVESVVQETPLQMYGKGSHWDMYNDWMKKRNVSLAAIQQPCFVDGVLHIDDGISPESNFDALTNTAKLLNTTVPNECLFEMPQSIWISLWNELSFALNSNCSSMDEGGVQCRVRRTEEEVGHPSEGIPSYPAHMAALYRNNSASVESINKTFNALAERLTAAIRFDGRRLETGDRARVTGDLLESKVCVRFVWQWLTFPGALLVSSALLLGAIVIKDTVAKKANIWKSSILPFLLKDHVGTKTISLNGLEEVAQGLEVKLQRGKTQQDVE